MAPADSGRRTAVYSWGRCESTGKYPDLRGYEKAGRNSILLFCPEQITGEDTAYIQFSSGSTNSPKGVVLKHSNIIYNVEQIGNGLNLTEKDVSESWKPLTHDMGLVGFHITTFCRGIIKLFFLHEFHKKIQPTFIKK